MWKARDPKWLLIGLVAAAVGIQLVPTRHKNPPVETEFTIEANTTMTPEVEEIFARACYDCHSNQTRWPWYSYVAPVSWVITDDVRRAREHYNFSEWATQTPKDADHTLDEICEEVERGQMPLPSYLWLHSDAQLSEDDIQTVCDWTGAERGRIRAAMAGNPKEPEEGDSEDDD